MRNIRPIRLPARITAISWRDLAASLGPILVISLIAIWAAFRFVRPAPPDTIIITAGPEDSTIYAVAEKYRKILARNGVRLQILTSEGSVENLKRLSDPSFQVEVGFVQGGLASSMPLEGLVSLGSLAHQPLAIFYRNATPIDRLSKLRGRKLAIGREGLCHPGFGIVKEVQIVAVAG